MIRTILLAASILMPGLAHAQAPVAPFEHHSDSEGALGVAKGPAAGAIKAELARRNLSCSDMQGVTIKCRLTDNALNGDVHYGEPTPGERVAFVSVRWQSDPTGNAVDSKGLVFTSSGGADYRFVGSTDIPGTEIDKVLFEPGKVTYETSYMRPNDSRVSPTGKRRYQVAYGDRGLKVDAQRATAKPKELRGSIVGSPTTEVPAMELHRGTNSVTPAQVPASDKGAAHRFEEPYALLRWLYGLPNDMKLSDRFKAKLAPGLKATYANAFMPPLECAVLDGDPRVGGAQGVGRLTLAFIETMDPAKVDGTGSDMTFDLRVKDSENPKAVKSVKVRLLYSKESGWEIGEITEARSGPLTAMLRKGIAECGSPEGKAREARVKR